ncbi:MAG: hypothetical protein K0R08_29 [Solimicrobium sp.]|nr:hypothetical protein [Solimicrobium sp.]
MDYVASACSTLSRRHGGGARVSQCMHCACGTDFPYEESFLGSRVSQCMHCACGTDFSCKESFLSSRVSQCIHCACGTDFSCQESFLSSRVSQCIHCACGTDFPTRKFPKPKGLLRAKQPKRSALDSVLMENLGLDPFYWKFWVKQVASLPKKIPA